MKKNNIVKVLFVFLILATMVFASGCVTMMRETGISEKIDPDSSGKALLIGLLGDVIVTIASSDPAIVGPLIVVVEFVR